MKLSYKTTMFGCFAGYAVQAIIINFAPLLFVFFQDTYQIPLSRITLLLTANFIVQLLTDFLSTQFVDRIGYRASMIIAHFAAAAGLVALTVLPEIMDPFAGLLINLIGCGLCGISVAIMWPGTLSKASATLPTGGTAMFALLALAGDVGCSAGPTLVGMVSDGAGGNMKAGILAGIVFPAVLLLCLLLWKKPKKDGVA